MMHRVMQMDAPKREPTKAITVRVPEQEYNTLRTYAEDHKLSLNMVVSDAIAEHTAKLERRAVLNDIAAFQKRLGKTTEPTSVEDLYEIRRARTGLFTSDRTEAETPKEDTPK